MGSRCTTLAGDPRRFPVSIGLSTYLDDAGPQASEQQVPVQLTRGKTLSKPPQLHIAPQSFPQVGACRPRRMSTVYRRGCTKASTCVYGSLREAVHEKKHLKGGERCREERHHCFHLKLKQEINFLRHARRGMEMRETRGRTHRAKRPLEGPIKRHTHVRVFTYVPVNEGMCLYIYICMNAST